MATIIGSLEITTPGIRGQLFSNVNKEITRIVKRNSVKVSRNIKEHVEKLLRSAIVGSPEYESFFGGKLQAELGVPDPSVIDTVIEQWMSGVTVKFLQGEGRFGTLSIGMIEDDYSDVLTLPDATYSYSSRKGGGLIDWLRFLLLEGSNVIVRDYDFTDSTKRGSRTGLGIMVGRSGGSWKVPDQFAGTAGDNFVLRALQEIDTEIDNIVRREVTRGFK
jgi:hypothetical protein